MKNQFIKLAFGGLLGLSASVVPLSVSGQANLESPANGGATSGIGQIRGWSCARPSDGLIQIEIDGERNIEAPYGSDRKDTEETCGDRANGWGTTFNFNQLGAGEHTLVASVDGEEFDRATFTVGRPSDENYLKGAPKTFYILPDFPEKGSATVVQWQQTEQNFMIVETPSGIVPDDGTWTNAETTSKGNFEVCWQVSEDGSRLTSTDSGCPDGSSLWLFGAGTTAEGRECQIGVVTGAEIPILDGLFVHIFADPVGIDSVASIAGRFTDKTNATGRGVVTSVTINECTVEFTNKL